ncbi:hypothetical protein CR513_01761, partial [Mucuna pruriens]
MENFLKSKEYWGIIKKEISKLQAFYKEFEISHVKVGESVLLCKDIESCKLNENAQGEVAEEMSIVEKIQHSLTSKFDCDNAKFENIITMSDIGKISI